MGRQHDAHAIVGDGLHQLLKELVPCQGIEASHRFVEDQQFGSFRDRKGECQLGALPAGQFAGALLAIEPELIDAPFGDFCIEAGGQPPAQPQMIGHRKRGVDGRVLRDETNPPELRRTFGRSSTEDSDLPGTGCSKPTARCSSVVFPAPFGPTRPTTRPAGTCSVQSRNAQRWR